MMPDTCGPTSHEQLTCFDLGSASSRTSKGTSVKGEPKSWSRLSQWGTASSGGWFELPTPVPLTAARGSSSSQLLPTSRATDGSKGGPGQVNGRGVADSLPGVAPLLRGGADATHAPSPTRLSPGLLPTPTVQQGRNRTSGRSNPDSQHHTGTTLNDLVFDGTLLPTPTSRDHKDGASAGADVPVNALLGRTVWALAPTRQPSDDGNTSSEGQHPNPLSPPDATADTDSTHA